MKKSQAPRIKLVARRPGLIKAVLRTWIAASDQVDADPLKLNGAPPWVENAWAEVVKVVMPGHRLPVAGSCDMERIGEIFGRLQAFGKVHDGEIPLGPEVQAEQDRFQKIAAAQPLSPAATASGKAAVKDLQARLDAVARSIPDLTKAALASSHADTIKYQKGLSRGLNLSADDLVSANVFERHTRTCYVLAQYWRFWVTCKSLAEVHGHLCRAVGGEKIGGFKTFEKLCAKISFKLRGRGRPPGRK